MTDEEIEQIIALSQKATQGPWNVIACDIYCENKGQQYWFAETADEADAKYFAALSPEKIRSLIKRLRRAENMVAEYHESYEREEYWRGVAIDNAARANDVRGQW